MKVEQISVFIENKSGRIAEVTKTLADADVNIRALSVADTSDFGVLRLIVDDNKKAKDALKKNGFTISETNVVAVEVEDKPGGLNKILTLLHQANLNVEYMYSLVRPGTHNAVMIFRFDQREEAVKMLLDNGLSVIEGKKVYTL